MTKRHSKGVRFFCHPEELQAILEPVLSKAGMQLCVAEKRGDREFLIEPSLAQAPKSTYPKFCVCSPAMINGSGLRTLADVVQIWFPAVIDRSLRMGEIGMLVDESELDEGLQNLQDTVYRALRKALVDTFRKGVWGRNAKDNDPIDRSDPSGTESPCATAGHCDVDLARIPANAKAMASVVADITPVVGAVKGVVEAVQNPTTATIVGAVVRVIPEVGAVAKEAISMEKAVVKAVEHVGEDAKVIVTTALSSAETWLGSGYSEIGSGVFRSADGLRKLRMTTRDLLPTHGNIGPHVHFEALDDLGAVIENLHIPVTP